MIGRLGNLIQTNLAVWLTALVVAGAVIGAGFGVRSLTDREDGLREAKTDLAELANLTTGMRAQAETALEHSSTTRSDVILHRRIGRAALASARQVEGRWDNRLVTGIERPVRLLSGAGGALLRLSWEDDPAAVVRNDLDRLDVRADALSTRVGAADRELSRQIESSEAEATALSFGLSGAVALALVALIVTVAALWRRGMRGRNRREAAELGERRLRALARHGSDMITVLAPDGTVKYEAGAAESLLGYEPAEMEGRKLREWLHPDDVEILSALCDAGEGDAPVRELRLRHRDGGYRTCEARAASLLGDELWDGIVLNAWDVTERKQLEERLRRQAFHDGLTGLPNRVLFNERLEHALARGVRAGCAVSVFLIDLDDFKSINDGLGHPAGDELLRRTARRLDEALRGADTVARLGGDEFAVIFDESVATEDDEEAAWRILAALSAPFELGDRTFPVSASIGIARAQPGEGSVERLVRDADMAMYAAKSAQKGTFAVYHEEMHLASSSRLQLKADLASAVAAGDQLELYYQPVVTLDDAAIVGFEALLRWHHPERGLVQPPEFVRSPRRPGRSSESAAGRCGVPARKRAAGSPTPVASSSSASTSRFANCRTPRWSKTSAQP